MNALDCLNILREIKDVTFCTVDNEGMPQARIIDVMLVEDKKIYFCTARGKSFYHELMESPNVAIASMNSKYQMVRLTGEAYKLSDQKKWIDRFFEENPSMKEIYKGESRYILEPFCIENAEIDFLDIGTSDLKREHFVIGKWETKAKYYLITEECIECGKCKKQCPQECIEEGSPFKIHQNHCIKCGLCYEICPVHAIENKK